MNPTLNYILMLAVAAIMGGIIGVEREYRAKEAGLRTHLLVALGSALFMVLSQYGFGPALIRAGQAASYDPSRIASQVVTGIGFIGAGTIILQKHVVKGLTTAAGLWVTSAIGMACGAGMYAVAVAATVMVVVCLEAMAYVHGKFDIRTITVTLTADDQQAVSLLLQKIQEQHIEVESYKMQPSTRASKPVVSVEMEMRMAKDIYQSGLLSMMQQSDGVTVDAID